MRLERINYKTLIPEYQTYFVESYKLENLLKIAFWRNEVLPSLRSSHPTPVNIIPQIQWVKSFNLNTDNYFFIYSDEIYTHEVLIGYCGLDKVNRINKTAEMSLLINPQLHRKGYGKRAVRKLLNYGFNKLKLQCIYIECYTTTSNWKFWKKVGFKEEGRLRRRKLLEGKYYDSIIASILKEEWEKMNDEK